MDAIATRPIADQHTVITGSTRRGNGTRQRSSQGGRVGRDVACRQKRPLREGSRGEVREATSPGAARRGWVRAGGGAGWGAERRSCKGDLQRAPGPSEGRSSLFCSAMTTAVISSLSRGRDFRAARWPRRPVRAAGGSPRGAAQGRADGRRRRGDRACPARSQRRPSGRVSPARRRRPGLGVAAGSSPASSGARPARAGAAAQRAGSRGRPAASPPARPAPACPAALGPRVPDRRPPRRGLLLRRARSPGPPRGPHCHPPPGPVPTRSQSTCGPRWASPGRARRARRPRASGASPSA